MADKSKETDTEQVANEPLAVGSEAGIEREARANNIKVHRVHALSHTHNTLAMRIHKHDVAAVHARVESDRLQYTMYT